MEFSRQEYRSGLPFLSAGYVSNPGTKPASPVSPALQAGSFPTEPSGKVRCGEPVWHPSAKLLAGDTWLFRLQLEFGGEFIIFIVHFRELFPGPSIRK